MRFIVSALIASLAFASASTHHSQPHTEKELESLFTNFVKTHNKKYAADEFFSRFNIFKTNVEMIRKHNNSGARFTMSTNQFADMTHEEFKATKLGFKNVDHSVYRSKNLHVVNAAANPDSVDWRSSNIVTPVKDQGQCGSCWAFSTTGSVEAAVAQASNTSPVSLSEQELVDCSTSQGNQGCNGGLMDYGFQYIISKKGLSTESAYPYTAADGTCTGTKNKHVSPISSFKDVAAGDEDALEDAVAQQPVSVAIEADQQAFQFYSGGVLTAACGTNLDHGVLAVGYGTDNGTNYWIVKNSWGATWGEAGYIRLEKGINQCGIANSASYPVV